MDIINCPYCGSAIQEQEAGNKIWNCNHCSHALLLQTQPLPQPIQTSTDTTALITLGTSFVWRQQQFTTHDFLSFNHDEGVRTEWLVKDEGGDDYYLVADEENFFLLQSEEKPSVGIPSWEALQPNTHFSYDSKDWLVTEQRQMTLVEGSGSRHETYLVTDDAQTLMILFYKDTVEFRKGFWLDPFEIEVAS